MLAAVFAKYRSESDLKGPISASDYARFETHRDPAVRVWHARLEGASMEATAATSFCNLLDG
ncbi:hypothetical protein [uncultured Jannaschia sp.]|uniref:hypothetical protein n=1 Tax=uncultured Jannaschia sp. TaxID=293347 RepID=UPI002618F066|nr:hypothetical protein [uncultured Jannaschia sp.]